MDAKDEPEVVRTANAHLSRMSRDRYDHFLEDEKPFVYDIDQSKALAGFYYFAKDFKDDPSETIEQLQLMVGSSLATFTPATEF